MAAASLTVFIKDLQIRKYGGNRSDVRNLKRRYEKMTFSEMKIIHPGMRESDLKDINFLVKFNKN